MNCTYSQQAYTLENKITSSVTTARVYNEDLVRNYGPRFTRWRSARPQVRILPMTDETNAGKSINNKYSRYMYALYYNTHGFCVFK